MSKWKRNYRAHMHVHTYTHTHTHKHKVFIETYTHKSRPIWKEILSKVSGENKRSKMESVGCVCGRLIIQEQWLQTLTPPPLQIYLRGTTGQVLSLPSVADPSHASLNPLNLLYHTHACKQARTNTHTLRSLSYAQCPVSLRPPWCPRPAALPYVHHAGSGRSAESLAGE